jgi:hypothetical protein
MRNGAHGTVVADGTLMRVNGLRRSYEEHQENTQDSNRLRNSGSSWMDL